MHLKLTLDHPAVEDGTPIFVRPDGKAVPLILALPEVRDRFGFTQEQMAKAWQVSVRSLRNWELGARNCPAKHLNRLAQWVNGDRKPSF